MFCPKCGKELPPNAKFCAGCGSAAPLQNQPPYQSAPQNGPVPPAPKPRRSKKPFLLFIPAVAVALAVLITLNFTAIAARLSPDYALNRGFHKLSSTMEKQTFQNNSDSLLSTLAEYLQNGACSFSGEFTDPNYGDAVTFSGEWSANKDSREFLLQDFTGSVSGESIHPLSIYLSPEAFALNSIDVTGNNNWYGLYLDRPVSEQVPDSLSLDPLKIAQLQVQIDSLSSLLSKEEDPTAQALAKELRQVFDDFLDSSRPSASSETVRVVNSKLNATVLTYRFTMPDLAVLADNFFDVLLKEEYVSYLANRYSAGIADMMFFAGSSLPDEEAWASSLEESRQEIVSALRTQAEGEVVLCFALASDGTLVKVSCTFEAEDGYGSTASVTCSFSMDPDNGDFALLLQADSNGSSLMEASLTNTSTNEPDCVNQTLVLDMTDPYNSGENSIILSSDWNPSDHNFSSSLLVTSGGTVVAQLTADGTLDIGKDTLDLNLDKISFSAGDRWSSGLEEVMRGSFHLSAGPGSPIQMPDFESIFSLEAAGLF